MKKILNRIIIGLGIITLGLFGMTLYHVLKDYANIPDFMPWLSANILVILSMIGTIYISLMRERRKRIKDVKEIRKFNSKLKRGVYSYIGKMEGFMEAAPNSSQKKFMQDRIKEAKEIFDMVVEKDLEEDNEE